MSRLLEDYNKFKKNRPLGATGGPINESNLTEWEVIIPGPVGSPFEGGKFKIKIILDDYPNSPPKCNFITKIFHPNINFEKGTICVNFLKKAEDKPNIYKSWTNKNTITDVILGLYGLLKFPNQDSPLNSNANALYRRDKIRHNQLAKSFTNKFAK